MEGIRLVEEALAAGLVFRGAVVSTTLARTARGGELREELEQRGVPVEEVSERTFAQLADTETPQGIVAVVQSRKWTVAEFGTAPGGALLVVDGVQDPGNVGTLIRTAHALGAAGTVVLRGTADVHAPKTMRSAMGATFRHPVVAMDDNAFITWARKAGVTLWATAADGAPIERALRELRSDSPAGPVAVIVGNEGAGIRPALNAISARRVAIPLAQGAESLNVAVAAGILLYQVMHVR
ncbi:MAG TPA: RNA methyltransferase [Gemmatimonadales bacterium]